MAAQENEHRRLLIELYRRKFGEHIPTHQDVRGFIGHEPRARSRHPRAPPERGIHNSNARQIEEETGRRMFVRAAGDASRGL
jgi:hypothetical protein